MEKEKKEKKEKQKSWVLVTVLIICLLVVATMGGYFIGATKFSTKLIENHKRVVEKENTVTEQEVAVEDEYIYHLCTGTYKGSCVVSTDAQTGEQTKGDCTLTLKEDGNYNFKSSYTEDGSFIVKDNTLVLITSKHTVGPKDEDPSMNVSSHLITEDCSTIKMKLTTDEAAVELKRE